MTTRAAAPSPSPRGASGPSAEILEVGADPVVLSGSIDRTGRPELFSYNPRLDGFTLKVDGETRTELPGGAAVVPGRRTVELTKGDAVLVRREVDMAAGERLPLEELLAETFPHRSLSLVGGLFSFVDGKSRNELLPASPEVALCCAWRTSRCRTSRLLLDVGGSRGRHTLKLAPGSEVPFGYTRLSLGAGMPYLWRWDRLSLYAGPRVAALYLRRSFDVEAFAGGQHYFTVSPGVVGGVVWRLSDGWS